MNLERWQLFVQIAELGSLSKAAAVRDTTQSAVSRQVRALETYCGARLFHRTGRGVALSEPGKRIFTRVKAWTDEAEQLAKDVKATAGNPVGVVRIGSIESTVNPLIKLLFQRSRKQYPGIQLRIVAGSSGQVSESLDQGQIDVGIVFRYEKGARSDDHPLLKVDTCLIGPAGDAITRAPTVPFSKLDELPLILPGFPNTLRVVLDQIASRKRMSLNVIMESESLAVEKEIVAGGGGYTILGTHAVSRELEAGTLQAARIVSPTIERTIALRISRHHPTSDATREIARLIRLCMDDLGKAGRSQRPSQAQ